MLEIARISQIRVLNTKIVVLAALTNFLELYNYILFAAMIPVISSVFFPHESSFISLAFTYASFGITFLIAPVGALYWGKIGDKYGANKVLQYSSMLMAIPSIMIFILPDHSSIGIAAPILIILLRLLQGFSASGEVQGSKILAMSSVPDSHFGKVSGAISASGALGVLFAFFLSGYAANIGDDAWRYCFALGGVLVLISRVIKYSFRNQKIADEFDNEPTSRVLKDNKQQTGFVFIIGGVLGILSYTLHAFLTPYMISMGRFGPEEFYMLSMIALLSTAISAILCGVIIDKITLSFLHNFLILQLIFIMCSMPVYWQLLLSSNFVDITLAYALIGVNLGFYASCSGVAIFKVFPPSKICRGLLPSNAAGVAFFGGTAPFLMHILADINHFLPVLLIIATASMAIVKMKTYNLRTV